MLISGGEISWLARAYAIAVVIAALLKLLALVRYRAIRAGTRAYRVPLNLKVGGREWPLGLIGAALLLAIAAGALVAAGDPPSLAGLVCVAAVAAALLVSERSVAGQPAGPRAVVEDFQLLPADVVDLRQVDVSRPGNFLVPVRRPHILAHLVGALRDAGDRDVVAMTVRLVGVDVPDDPSAGPRTPTTRAGLLSAVVALAEREGVPVRLSIVPGVNVFDSSSRPPCGSSRPRFTSASPKRCRPTIRRGCSATPGSGRACAPPSTSGSSSTIRAAAPPRITSARTRPRSDPRISNISTGSGSMSSEPSVQACTTTT